MPILWDSFVVVIRAKDFIEIILPLKSCSIKIFKSLGLNKPFQKSLR